MTEVNLGLLFLNLKIILKKKKEKRKLQTYTSGHAILIALPEGSFKK